GPGGADGPPGGWLLPSSRHHRRFPCVTRLSLWCVPLGGQVAGPPDVSTEIQVERGDEDRSYDDRVENDPEGDREADLGARHHREGTECGERTGQHQPG